MKGSPLAVCLRINVCAELLDQHANHFAVAVNCGRVERGAALNRNGLDLCTELADQQTRRFAVTALRCGMKEGLTIACLGGGQISAERFKNAQ